MKKALPTVIGLACVGALGFGLNALMIARAAAADEANEPGGPSGQRILAVETMELRWQETVSVPRRFTGEITARRTADLAFDGSGRVTALYVDEGDEVEAGAPLGQLDDRQLGAQRAEVVARRGRLLAQLEELRAGPRKESVDAARSNVAAILEQVKLAVLQRDRRAELAKKGTISAEQLDTTNATVKELEARLAASRATLAELENGTRAETLRAQESALAESDAALRSVDIALERTTLSAPFDGMIEKRFLDEGAIVSEQMPSAAFRIVEAGHLEARIGVPADLVEQALRSVGSTARLTLRGTDLSIEAARALPTVAAGTRTVEIVLALEAASTETAGARPGDTVTLAMEVERQERGAWIPLGALKESARGLWSALAVKQTDASPSGFSASRIDLEVLTANESEAFVRGTFEDGTTIVAAGMGRLVPGQAIRPAGKKGSNAPPIEAVKESLQRQDD